jgi:hypothetical protein
MSLSRFALALLLSVTWLGRVSAGPPIPTQLEHIAIVPEYYEKVSALLKSTVCNHRVKGMFRMWDPLVYNPKKSFDMSSEEVYGSEVWLKRFTEYNHDKVNSLFEVLTEDEVYTVRRVKQDAAYTIGKHHIEWEEPAKYLQSFRMILAVKAQVFLPYDSDKFVTSSEDVFEGRKAIKLEFTDSRQIPLTVYLDKETHQFLYSEKPRSYDMATQKVKDEKLIARTTYKEVGGKRLPERYDEYKLTAKGEKLPQHVIEFTEYTPYTPTADELDMEKRFGVKPIPHGPRPDSARPGSKKWPAAYWWYVAGGVVVLAAIAVLVVSRLRRKRT